MYIMKEYKNGEDAINITKYLNIDPKAYFVTNNKPVALTTEEAKSDVDKEIKREEIKN